MKVFFAWSTLCLLLVFSGCTNAPIKKTAGKKAASKVGTEKTSPAPATKPAPAARPASVNPLPPLLMTQPPASFWTRLRRGFSLAGRERPAVRHWIKFYTHPPANVEQILQRATPYIGRITHAVAERDMPLEIALLPAVESGFKPYAYSSSDAAGLWQFKLVTARRFGLHRDWWYDGRRDIPSATKAALNYLQFLHKTLGTWARALAAYNCGEGCVQHAIEHNAAREKSIDFWDLSLSSETENYVPKLLAVAAVVAHPGRYNVTLPEISDAPYSKLVRIPGQIDLALVAKLAGVSVKKILELNPGYNRWATDPHGPHHLLIPAAGAKKFKTGLAKLSQKKLVHWHRHRIQRGDTLNALAHRYNTTVAVLQQINHLSGTGIRTGDELLIPARMHSLDSRTRALITQRRQLAKSLYGGRIEHYRVKPGDTLWSISRKHHVKVAQIARWNGVSRHAVLHPDETLVLHRSGSVQTISSPESPAQTRYYTVTKGDSLYAIAEEFDVSIADLQRWNDLDGHIIRPGERLKVKAGATPEYSSS